MKNTALSSRYAKAYIDLASERSQLPEAISACHRAIELLDENPNIELVLDSPLESIQSKLDCASKKISSIKVSILDDLIFLLVSKGRSGYLREMLEQAIILNDKLQGIVKADVFSAEKLSADQFDSIKSNIKSSTQANIVELTEHIDHSLLGGFKVRLGDKVWDSTIAGQLENIKKKYS